MKGSHVIRLRKWVSSWLALLLLVSMLAMPTSVSAGEQLHVSITNAGFETGSPPSGWSVYGCTWGTQCTTSTTRSIDGSKSLKINDASSTAAYGMVSDKVAAHPYSTYEAIVSVYADSGSGQVYLEFWDNSSTRLGFAIGSTTTTGAWEYVIAKGQAPAGTTKVSVMAYSPKTNTGASYYDAVSLKRIDEVGDVSNNSFESADGSNMPVDWTVAYCST